MTPVFAHGQLRLYLLALLEAGPRHGYELITALSDRFGGTYRPSPGTVYPRLARLEEEGLVRRHDDGRKATYTLTDAGRAELAARRGDLAALEEDLAETVRALAGRLRDDVRDSMAGLRADLAAAAQQARAGSRAHVPPPVPPHPHAPPHRQPHHRAEAEVLLQRFRDDLRADLRRADRQGGVDALTVETLRTVLDGAASAVRATLPR
ncbi:PadR family transcriptional regulator [Actinotalea solisilvae]|uniref:PadR family transcriptional regulator n=1 Tax=Actinotalea solisilvae TaxID=2072922 RepID=UPI0018F1F258|nr:PadR family transcriptional regulator [Actinotalea solisilvae]